MSKIKLILKFPEEKREDAINEFKTLCAKYEKDFTNGVSLELRSD